MYYVVLQNLASFPFLPVCKNGAEAIKSWRCGRPGNKANRTTCVHTQNCMCIMQSGWNVASFPGLPRFFCSSVSVDNNTRMRKGGEKRGVFRRPSASVYYCQRKPKNRKKRGRPGNEARWNATSLIGHEQ